MTLTLPLPLPATVWVASPAWIFDQWHWAYIMVFGLAMFIVGSIVNRMDRSFASGLLLVLSLAPTLLGIIGGSASWYFSLHNHPLSTGETWSRTKDDAHTFAIASTHLSPQYKTPPRNTFEENHSINKEIQHVLRITPLRPQTLPIFVLKHSGTDDLRVAHNGTPFLINNDVYTCVMEADSLSEDIPRRTLSAHVVSAACVNGNNSLFVTVPAS